jgi:hypothetical protein
MTYCCDDMRSQVEYRCPDHPDPYECTDNIVVFSLDGYFGIPIHDGGSSHIVIAFCPWCGVEAPWSIRVAAPELPLGPPSSGNMRSLAYPMSGTLLG